MAIILRADTGSALTHNQVDTNFTSFFYSSSISGNTLTLFKTGSGALSIAVASSSIVLPGGTVWTASAADISRNGDATITGSLKQGSAGLIATGLNAHAEGITTQAVGWYSHAEGRQTQARGSGSHAEGYVTVASGSYSHTEGVGASALGYGSHAEGESTQAIGQYAHAEGNLTVAFGQGSHAEGTFTLASGSNSHAEGFTTIASGSYAHAEGSYTLAVGQSSHTEGYYTTASATYSHAEGSETQAKGIGSHAEGRFSIASGSYSHAEGNDCVAQGDYSHAEGYTTDATGNYAHSEGSQTIASGIYSHAEGLASQATGEGSHAEGQLAQATGTGSHAEGYGTIAQGNWSHAEGFGTYTQGNYQTAVGSYNVLSSSPSAFIIGNGTGSLSRSNLLFASGSQVQISGSLNMSGSVTINNGYDLIIHGNKQFNYGMFYHTASISVANGTSGSALLSTTAVANGVSIVSGSRITMANAGYYNIQFSAQLAQGANTANFYLWFRKNGTNIPFSNSKKTLTNNTNQIMTVDIIDYASTAGDYYEIVHQSDAANSTLEYIAASGNYPAAPSIIVTVQQVR